jgi:hypothetical protein
MREKFFLFLTPGKDDLLILDQMTVVETFASPGVVEFARTATLGQARMLGPQLVMRLDSDSVRERENGKFELRPGRGAVVGKTPDWTYPSMGH